MLDKLDGPTKLIISILGFPVFFQESFLHFAWGGGDLTSVMLLKRTLLLLPVLAILFSCWVTVVCALTIIFRHERRDFVTALFVTWWDLGRSILAFWGGALKFILVLIGWVLGAIRITFFMVLLFLKDLVFLPVKLAQSFGSDYLKAGVPWIAITLTLFWSLLEALIFTFVMTPLVGDTLSGIVGVEVSGLSLQIPLYLMFIIFVLGSYAALLKFQEALTDRKFSKIITYLIVEIVVAAVEIVFLYREFVDALEPWFAQHASDDFQFGLLGTFAIAGFAWLGIRAMTWFLFAASGLPPIMAILQGEGVEGNHGSSKEKFSAKDTFVFVGQGIQAIKDDLQWFHKKAQDVLTAFLVPPLQIVAAVINFCTLLLNSSHLFDLPFNTYEDILTAKSLLEKAKRSLK